MNELNFSPLIHVKKGEEFKTIMRINNDGKCPVGGFAAADNSTNKGVLIWI